MAGKKNPRSANGNLRRKHIARIRAMGLPCYLCGKPIHYDEPSDAMHPLSLTVDEIRPVSRYKEFGYPTPRAAAEDWNNLAPTHRICNARKSNKTLDEIARKRINNFVSDGVW